MSTDADELIRPAAGPVVHVRANGLRASAIGFVCLLMLALVWPAPVVWLNDRTFDASLSVDERSFLGREAPAWDVVFWAITGIFALSLLHGRIDQARSSMKALAGDLRLLRSRSVTRLRELGWKHLLIMLASLVAVVGVWMLLDAVLVALAELLRSDQLRMVGRFANRLGGGMNPTMIIIFFGFAGIIFAHLRWVRFAIAMTAAGLVGGILVQLLKLVVSRSRPELWLGPFDHSGPLASSFPSGHTVSAFAIASVLWFGSRSIPLRFISIALATAVASSRVLSFRHWPSDVFASALIGLLFGWFFITAIQRHEPR